MVHYARGTVESDDCRGAPDDVLSAYSSDLDSLIEEVSGRIVEELGCIVSDPMVARQLVSGKSFWRAHLVLGLAQRNNAVTARHMDVAMAVELLDLAFDTHVVGTLKAIGPYEFGFEIDEGKMVLAGDYYLTRAATSALRSDRIETLRQISLVMSAIPAGHLVKLEQPASPYRAIHRYVRSRRYFYGKVASACLKASLAESGIAHSAATKLDMLAALTASAVNSRRDWIKRSAFPALRDWDLPLLVALKSQPLERRDRFFSSVADQGNHSAPLIEREIANTRALETCGRLAQGWASSARNALADLFPVALVRQSCVVAPPHIVARPQ